MTVSTGFLFLVWDGVKGKCEPPWFPGLTRDINDSRSNKEPRTQHGVLCAGTMELGQGKDSTGKRSFPAPNITLEAFNLSLGEERWRKGDIRSQAIASALESSDKKKSLQTVTVGNVF